jgi:hypothetical protein
MAKFDSYREGTPSWVEHEAPDQAAAKEFYGGLFGWEYDDQPTDQGGVYSLATIEADRVAGLSGQQPDRQGQPAQWNVYLAADDVDGAAERALASGGKVLADPMDVGPAGRMAVVQDPGGAIVGLWQGGELAGAERANEPGTNIWNELTVDDIDGTAGFYREVLGLEPEKQDMGPDAGAYTTFSIDGRSVAGAMPIQPGMRPHWNVYFNVDDVDATVARAQELGAEVAHPAFDIPGVGRLGYLRDPQGATFNLLQNPPEEPA